MSNSSILDEATSRIRRRVLARRPQAGLMSQPSLPFAIMDYGMRKTIATGATPESAWRNAAARLGVDREES